MKMTPKDFQRWLNERGAKLKVDGQIGSKTQKGLRDIFTDKNAQAIDQDTISAIAGSLGGTSRQIRAVASVESSGGGWDKTGLLKILWERHYFFKRIQILIPWISNPKGGDYTLDANRNGVNDSWEKLCLACARDPIAAFESASWGQFQIMGAHAEALGYENALEFAYSMVHNQAEHYHAMAAYVRTNRLSKAFASLSTNPVDCLPFARGYNGPKQKGYHDRLAKAMK